MKHIKRLIPILSTLAVASIAITSCQQDPGDGYVAIPSDKLNIEDNSLKGFKDPTSNLDGYTKLTITSNITEVSEAAFSFTEGEKAFNAITKIDFEERNATTTIATTAFSALPELKVLEFPSDCRRIILNTNSFLSCKKLDTIDFSKVQANCFAAEFDTVKWAYTIAAKGTIYANSSNKTEVESIRTILELDNTNWPIVVK